MASSTALAPRYEPPMPMQTTTSAFERSFAASFRMASISFSEIEEGRCTQPQKIVAGAFARMQQGIGGLRFGLDVGGNFNARLGNVQFHIFHHIAN